MQPAFAFFFKLSLFQGVSARQHLEGLDALFLNLPGIQRELPQVTGIFQIAGG